MARIVDLPGGRFIDLRSFPPDDLRLGNWEIAREQIKLDAMSPVKIWVVDAATAAAWVKYSAVGLMIVVSKLSHHRDPWPARGKNLVGVVGAHFSTGVREHFETAGIVAVEFGAFLEPPEPWAASADDRPILPSKVISTMWFADCITLAGDFVFVDLRRASPEDLRDHVWVLKHLEQAFDVLATMKPPKVMFWVLAPWVLAELHPDAIPRLRALVARVRPTLGHRQCVVAAAGEPVSAHPLITALTDAGAFPLRETSYLRLRTDKRGEFHVRPIDALHDIYFYQGWKHPSLLGLRR